MLDLEIRPYNDADRSDIIKAIYHLQDHESHLSSTRLAPTPDLCAQCFIELKKECDDKKGEILVALKGAQFSGFVAYYFESAPQCYETSSSKNFALISNICVLPEFRQQGTSQHLLQGAVQRILATGFKGHLRVWSLANNEAGIAAYERFGFIPFEVVFDKIIP